MTLAVAEALNPNKPNIIYFAQMSWNFLKSRVYVVILVALIAVLDIFEVTWNKTHIVT